MFKTEQLHQVLTEAFSDHGYIFQLVQKAPILEIYLNYPASGAKPSSQQVAKEVEKTIATTHWQEIQEVYLVGRQLGITEPEWDVQLKLEDKAVPEEKPSFEASSIHEKDEDLGKENTVKSTSIAAEVSYTESSGNKHIQPQSSEEFAPQDITKTSAGEEPQQTEEENSLLEIEAYCFIRNKQLITSQILPPPEELAQLIADFNDLESLQQKRILSQLQQYFSGKGGVIGDTENQQNWITNLENLPKTYNRKASIWISRYCANPVATMESINKVLHPPEPEPDPQPAVMHSTDGITNQELENSAKIQAQTEGRFTPYPHEEVQVEEIKSSKSSLIIPIIAFALTLILVSLDIQGRYSTGQFANICQDSSSSSEICQLSGQMVGLNDFKEFIQAGKSEDNISDDILDSDQISGDKKAAYIQRNDDYLTSQFSLGLCQGQAFGNAGFIIKDLMDKDFEGAEVEGYRSNLERVLPGVFSFQITVPHKETQELVSTYCTLSGPPQKMAYVKGDRIPNDWPEVPYTPQKTALGFFTSNIQLNFLASISLYTFFSGVGIFVAIAMGLAIRIETLNALYQAALVLGLVQYFLSILPTFGIFNIFFQPAILSMVLGLASIPIQGLEIEWSAGYRLVGSSLIVVELVRRLCSFLLLFTLFQLFA